MSLDAITRYGGLIPGVAFDAVALHPTADELEWLRANDMRPEDCTHVDLYWAGEGFVAFVAIASGADDAFVTYRQYEDDHDVRHAFFVSLAVGLVTRDIVVATLTWLSRWADEYPEAMRAAGPDDPRHIARVDITGAQ